MEFGMSDDLMIGMKSVKWIDINDQEVPRNGSMYLVADDEGDVGVVWWSKKDRCYGWVAEGETLSPDTVSKWSWFPRPMET